MAFTADTVTDLPYEKEDCPSVKHQEFNSNRNFFQPELRLAKFVPLGYSPSRCINLDGRPMMYAVMLFTGAGILFFGYDAAVMSQVNTNKNYLKLIGADAGTTADSALIGGIIGV